MERFQEKNTFLKYQRNQIKLFRGHSDPNINFKLGLKSCVLVFFKITPSEFEK